MNRLLMRQHRLIHTTPGEQENLMHWSQRVSEVHVEPTDKIMKHFQSYQMNHEAITTECNSLNLYYFVFFHYFF